MRRRRATSAGLTGERPAKPGRARSVSALLRRLPRSGGRRQWGERAVDRPEAAGLHRRRSSSAGRRRRARCPRTRTCTTAVTRGFVTTNMPSWLPLTDQTRVDLVAYIKTFSPRWETAEAGNARSRFRRRRPSTMESILRGRELFQKLECWKCHGPAGHGDGPSASTLTDSKDNPIRPYNFSTGTRFKCGATNQDLYRDLHDRRGRHADAVVRRQPEAGRSVGSRALPAHAAAAAVTQEATLWQAYVGRASPANSSRLGPMERTQ